MSNTLNNIATNRYPGVKPFSSSENFLFFGRESDIDALNSLIFIKQTVVLYSKSGYGKSSLINAGIIPRLQNNETWLYFAIRFNNFSDKEADKNLSPLQTTRKRFSDSLTDDKENFIAKLIPDENSLWYWMKQNQLQKKKNNFIVFFDQFEELFTYPKEQVDKFSEQLSQLLYTTIPVSFRKKIADLEGPSSLSDEQHDFLYEKPEIKIIFSIRSDRLSLMDGLKDKHPSILETTYELDALNINDARKAITGPAKLPQEFGFTTPSFFFTDGAVSKILNNIANPQDGKIEAATLQIVCRFIEDRLVSSRRVYEVNEKELGNIADIFQQYYQGVLDKLTSSEKIQAQRLIEDELIDGNRRNPLSGSYIKSKFGITENLLSILEHSSLLKKERDARGTILYEVSHDSLIGAINKIAENRRKEEEEKKQLELKAQIENEKKRSDELKILNNKVNIQLKRSRIALFIAVLAISAAIFLLFYSNQKKNQAEQATAEKETEREQAINAKQAADSLRVVAEKNLKELEEKNEKIRESEEFIGLQQKMAQEKEQYGIRVYSYTRKMMRVEQSIANVEKLVSSSPDLLKEILENAIKQLATTDILPKEIQDERLRLLNKINTLFDKIKS